MQSNKTDLAIENYLKAIELPPKDARWRRYHSGIGRGYLRRNEAIKALPYLQKGIEDEFDGGLGGAYYFICAAYTNIGDYEKAEVYGRKSAESFCYGIGAVSNSFLVQGKFREAFQFVDSICHEVQCEQECSKFLFRTSLLLGEFAKAEQYFNQWNNTGPEHSNSEDMMNYEIGYVYDQLGRRDEAAKIFAAQIKRQESELDSLVAANLNLARIYAFTGERNKALNYLTAYAKGGYTGTGNHRGWQDFILIDPFFASLRDDPEFQAIVKQAQEEKAALRAQVREMEERGELDL